MIRGRVTRDDVKIAVSNLTWAGLHVTARKVYKLIERGSMPTIVRFLRELAPFGYVQHTPKAPTLSERVKVLEERLAEVERRLAAYSNAPREDA